LEQLETQLPNHSSKVTPPNPEMTATTLNGKLTAKTDFLVRCQSEGSGSESSASLLACHAPLLKSWVRRKIFNAAEADDVVQQTLLLALRHIAQFRMEASLGTWLCSIATNVIRGRFRRPEYRRTVYAPPQVLELMDCRDPNRSPLAALESKERIAAFRSAIAGLPEILRAVIELRVYRGLSTRETAGLLSITPSAVKSRHFRARCLLIKALKQHDPRQFSFW
jgi:RNA polymerase sigma-70 factor (ECF subfamily)